MPTSYNYIYEITIGNLSFLLKVTVHPIIIKNSKIKLLKT